MRSKFISVSEYGIDWSVFTSVSRLRSDESRTDADLIYILEVLKVYWALPCIET